MDCRNFINKILGSVKIRAIKASRYIREVLNGVSAATWFYCVAVVALALPIMALYVKVDRGNAVKVLVAIADAMLIMMPYWIIRRRRWAALIPVWVSAVFVEINLLMIQWCGQPISFHAIYMTGNVDGLVLSNIPGLIRPLNYVVMLVAVGCTVAYVAKRRRINAVRYQARHVRRGIVATLVVFALGQVLLQWRWTDDNNSNGGNMLSVYERLAGNMAVRDDALKYKGYPLYVLTNFIQLFESRNLDSDELAEIVGFIGSQSVEEPSVEAFRENFNKNLIVVVVESLDAEAVTAMVDHRPVMPTLYGLLGDEGTVSNLNVVTQVKDGISGDGQIMVNTGLLPLRVGAASLEYASSTDFIALPHIIDNHNSVAVFAEDGSVWDKAAWFPNLGFERLVKSDEYAGRKWVEDVVMFGEACDIVEQIPRPYFMECLTLSMHAPFDKVTTSMPRFIADADLTQSRRLYYHACNEFDRGLAMLIDKIKLLGEWDETVMVIVSDHSMYVDQPEGEQRVLANIPMAFIAVNTGATIAIDKVAGQCDVFPTIIDIMGRSDYNAGVIDVEGKRLLWRGVGQSMLSPLCRAGAVDPRGMTHGSLSDEDTQRMTSAYDVSHNIIRGNFFSQCSR